MSAASVVAELAKIDALPGAKVEPSIGDGNVDAHTGNDALGMCGHVVRAFEDMTVVRHIFRYKPIANSLHVTSHVRVPILASPSSVATRKSSSELGFALAALSVRKCLVHSSYAARRD